MRRAPPEESLRRSQFEFALQHRQRHASKYCKRRPRPWTFLLRKKLGIFAANRTTVLGDFVHKAHARCRRDTPGPRQGEAGAIAARPSARRCAVENADGQIRTHERNRKGKFGSSIFNFQSPPPAARRQLHDAGPIALCRECENIGRHFVLS